MVAPFVLWLFERGGDMPFHFTGVCMVAMEAVMHACCIMSVVVLHGNCGVCQEARTILEAHIDSLKSKLSESTPAVCEQINATV